MKTQTGQIALQHPEKLVLHQNGRRYFGGSQEWFETEWQRRAGCGPTAAAHLMLYLAKTQPAAAKLWEKDTATPHAFLQLMQEVWQFVTPGAMGVHRPELLAQGAQRFAGEKGIALSADVQTVPLLPFGRPSPQKLLAFVEDMLRQDLPVAFLNLSAGTVPLLESWHWVTITGLNENMAEIFDQGNKLKIDLALWLQTTTLGGGFVALHMG